MAQFSFSSARNGPFWGFYNDFRSRDSHKPQNSSIQSENINGPFWSLYHVNCLCHSLFGPFWGSILEFHRDAKISSAKPNQFLVKVETPRLASSKYIAQHCLVHLGDIARYRHKNNMADSYYRYQNAIINHIFIFFQKSGVFGSI